MDNYTPSSSFTHRVMQDIHEFQNTQNKRQQRIDKLVSQLPARAILSCGAAVIGIWNVVRIYVVLFAPVLCK